jgi:hypothetical protein
MLQFALKSANGSAGSAVFATAVMSADEEEQMALHAAELL